MYRTYYVNDFIFEKFEHLHKRKNEYEEKTFMLHINSFIEKLKEKSKKVQLSLISICQIAAKFVDEMIEKILELEFSDFLQDLIDLLKSKYDECIEDSKREEKFLIGENDSYICELIRNDSVQEFIKYVNQSNISLFSEIKYSMYETNAFLMKHATSLIDYAVYFGSLSNFSLFINEWR